MKIPTDLMPLEYAAMTRELCTAYRLLEDHGELKPGDAVIVNGATAGGEAAITRTRTAHTHTPRALFFFFSASTRLFRASLQRSSEPVKITYIYY